MKIHRAPQQEPAAPDDHLRVGRAEILVLPEYRLALLRMIGNVSVATFMEAVRAAHAENPESASFDLVNDLRSHTGNLGVEGIKAGTSQRAAAWPGQSPAREVLLSRDPGMIFIARYLDLLAPHVEHSVCTDPAEAIARVTGGPVPAEALAFLGAG